MVVEAKVYLEEKAKRLAKYIAGLEPQIDRKLMEAGRWEHDLLKVPLDVDVLPILIERYKKAGWLVERDKATDHDGSWDILSIYGAK